MYKPHKRHINDTRIIPKLTSTTLAAILCNLFIFVRFCCRCHKSFWPYIQHCCDFCRSLHSLLLFYCYVEQMKKQQPKLCNSKLFYEKKFVLLSNSLCRLCLAQCLHSISARFAKVTPLQSHFKISQIYKHSHQFYRHFSVTTNKKKHTLICFFCLLTLLLTAT